MGRSFKVKETQSAISSSMGGDWAVFGSTRPTLTVVDDDGVHHEVGSLVHRYESPNE